MFVIKLIIFFLDKMLNIFAQEEVWTNKLKYDEVECMNYEQLSKVPRYQYNIITYYIFSFCNCL